MKDIKAKVSAKVSAAKAKVKAKVGKAGKAAKCTVILLALASVVGCMDTNPASRATSSADKLGDITVKFENCSNCTGTVNYTKGDSALASADSSGSTETQTLSPTQKTDVSPKTDVNTTGGRSAGVLESAIQAGVNWLMSPSSSSKSEAATPAATTAAPCADGTCTDGSCAPCTDGSCSRCVECSL